MKVFYRAMSLTEDEVEFIRSNGIYSPLLLNAGWEKMQKIIQEKADKWLMDDKIIVDLKKFGFRQIPILAAFNAAGHGFSDDYFSIHFSDRVYIAVDGYGIYLEKNKAQYIIAIQVDDNQILDYKDRKILNVDKNKLLLKSDQNIFVYLDPIIPVQLISCIIKISGVRTANNYQRVFDKIIEIANKKRKGPLEVVEVKYE